MSAESESAAAAYEEAASWDQAEFVYLRVADEAELSFQVREALTDAARIRMARGDRAGAIELYDRILDDLEETDPSRGLYEMRRILKRLHERETAALQSGGS